MTGARERELRLAEQLSQAHAAVEHLREEQRTLEARATAAEQALLLREAATEKLQRGLQAESTRANAAETGIITERQARETEREAAELRVRGLETELSAARADVARLMAEGKELLESLRRGDSRSQTLEAQLAELRELADGERRELEATRAQVGGALGAAARGAHAARRCADRVPRAARRRGAPGGDALRPSGRRWRPACRRRWRPRNSWSAPGRKMRRFSRASATS